MATDKGKLWELQILVQEFEKLDADLGLILLRKKNIDESLNIFAKIIELKEKIKEIITTSLMQGIGDTFANKLIKIRDNFGYNIDKIIPDNAWREMQKDKAQLKAWEQYLEREEDIDYGYLQRQNEIGTIIINTTFSENIQRNLRNIKECYAEALYDAAIIYCRALIEYVTFRLRKRKGFIPKNTRDFCERKLDSALNQIERFINPGTFKKIKDVKILADKILHSKDEIIDYKLTPFDAIRWTFIFVEEIQKVK